MIILCKMTLISSNIKTNILSKLDDIINIEDPNWSNLGIELKLKIVHNMCNFLKTNNLNHLNMNYNSFKHNSVAVDITSTINIPLKNQRPKKLIQLGGINKQINSHLFEEFRRKILSINRDFRKTYNSKNKFYSFANLSNAKYKSILINYNSAICEFMNTNINLINASKLYNNLIMGNQHKVISIKDIDELKINKINYKEEFLIIEFNNDVQIKLELYFTSEKITSNIPAKYKVFLTNII